MVHISAKKQNFSRRKFRGDSIYLHVRWFILNVDYGKLQLALLLPLLNNSTQKGLWRKSNNFLNIPTDQQADQKNVVIISDGHELLQGLKKTTPTTPSHVELPHLQDLNHLASVRLPKHVRQDLTVGYWTSCGRLSLACIPWSGPCPWKQSAVGA